MFNENKDCHMIMRINLLCLFAEKDAQGYIMNTNYYLIVIGTIIVILVLVIVVFCVKRRVFCSLFFSPLLNNVQHKNVNFRVSYLNKNELFIVSRKLQKRQKQLSTNVGKDLKLTELLKEENPVYTNNGIVNV